MKYVISAALLLVSLINYQYNLFSPVVYFLINSILLLTIYNLETGKSTLFKLIELLIVVWPISWINIIGEDTGSLQLPWFYIIGLLLAIVAFSKRKTKGTQIRGRKKVILCLLFLLIYSIVPLLICYSVTDGIGDYIMLLFFLVIIFAGYIAKDSIDNQELEELRTMFVYINFICAIGIIFQYIMYSAFGRTFFKIGTSGSFSGDLQKGCSLIFEDASCSTIMLGCGFIYSVVLSKKNKLFLFTAAIIIIGLALTSRRTSLVSLLIILIPLLFSIEKRLARRIALIIVSVLITAGALYFLNLSRPVNSYTQYLDNNGRFIDYESGIIIAIENPIGIGYGDEYLGSRMNSGIIPHNTLLRWLDQGGILLALPLVLVFLEILSIAKDKKLSVELWALIYTFLASNFIPDILNSRFLIIIFAVVLCAKEWKNE